MEVGAGKGDRTASGLQEGHSSEEEKVFSVWLLKNLQPVPWGEKICTNKHTTLLHLKPRHSILTLLQVLMRDVHWYSCSWVPPATRGGQRQLPLSLEQGENCHF